MVAPGAGASGQRGQRAPRPLTAPRVLAVDTASVIPLRRRTGLSFVRYVFNYS